MDPKVEAMLIGYMLQAGKTEDEIRQVIPSYKGGMTSQPGSTFPLTQEDYMGQLGFGTTSNKVRKTADVDNLLGEDSGNKNNSKTEECKLTDFQTKEEYLACLQSKGMDTRLAGLNWDEVRGSGSKPTIEERKPFFPFIGDMSLESRLYAFGQGLRELRAKNEEGENIYTGLDRAGAWGQTVGGAGSFLLGSARVLASGYSKRNAFIEDQQNRKNKDIYFTPNQQYRDANYTGGISQSKYGGMFEDGGEQEDKSEQMNPQMQQVMMQVAQAVEDGESPQVIIQALMKQGMSQEQASQILIQVVQRIQQHEMDESEDEEGGENEREGASEDLMMKKGGRFNYKVGDYIEFKAGGVLKKGKIKRIENGKIYL